MRISKLNILFFFVAFVNSQDIESQLYSNLQSKGEWGDYYLFENGTYRHVSNSVQLDSIYLISNNKIEKNTLNRLFYSIKGFSNANQVFGQLNSIEEAYPFLKNASSISFAKYDNERIAAILNVNPIFKSHIGGILGASRDNKGQWITTGELDLHLENFREKGNIVDLLWRQPDSQSRLIELTVEFPILFNLPFGSIISFDQEFYEKNYYIESKTALLTFIGPLGQWRFGGKTESSRNFYLNNKFNSTSIGIGLKGDRRNNRWLPYSGKYWVWNLNIGHQNDIYGKTQIIDSYFQLDQYRSLNSSVLHFSVWGGRNWIDDRKLNASKKIKFGGSKLLRGYHDNQFASDWVMVQTIEWIFGSLDRMQLFLFTDIPFSPISNISSAYGVGIRQYNGSILYNISIGFPGDISMGKIHISFMTNL